METQETDSVIHRKARFARDGFDARAMSPAKAFRLALAKASDGLFGLAVTVTTIEQVQLKHADIQKEMGENCLLILLDGNGGRRGVLQFDLHLLSALIEVQTMGKVSTREPNPRSVTRTDAAIVAPLVNALMPGFDKQMASACDDFVQTGFVFGDMAEDARAVSLALTAPSFDLFRISVDIEDGSKSGCLSILIPSVPKTTADSGKIKTSGSDANSLGQNAMNAPVTLDAAMARISVPLNEICTFKTGQKIPLPADSLRETLLLGSKGHVVSEVNLGQLNGMARRAFRFWRSR
ncbi:Surface presentation of antigens (SPOA) [Roseovarius litorisediminis]|uniref:Surface presentation of antigens (SPOA) n=2 Tax=Roseovarius litorisediminis TaxID=1312363 RepID=A0A1Y5RFI8_9RHOB|nr:Surface presentation of antigens (SPOA) [Roseovarius litorisediminis]